MKREIFLMLALFTVFFWRPLECAADVSSEETRGKLTITLSYEEENGERISIDGAMLEAIQVAGLETSKEPISWPLLPDFAESKLEWKEMKASEEIQAVRKLEQLILKKEKNGLTVRTDEKGRAVFEPLEPGIYLIRQKGSEKTAKRFEPIASYLTAVPQEEKVSGERVWNYDVQNLPKVELKIEKKPETKPTRESPKKAFAFVKTGDETTIAAYLLMAGAAAGFLTGIARKKKQK